jgi:hypothetical protein
VVEHLFFKCEALRSNQNNNNNNNHKQTGEKSHTLKGQIDTEGICPESFSTLKDSKRESGRVYPPGGQEALGSRVSLACMGMAWSPIPAGDSSCLGKEASVQSNMGYRSDSGIRGRITSLP